MTIDPLSDEKVIESWQNNASAWTKAVRENRIESRALITNQAILDAIDSRSPRAVLDLGCGEGWLVRALAERGISATGVDVVPGLIEQAVRTGGGDFRVISYEEIAAGSLDLIVDAVVANFSLIGKESVEEVLRSVPKLLVRGGALIIQTLHPAAACGDFPYEEGWRSGSWAGFSSDFTDPAPWYFRTMDGWLRLLERSGFSVVEVREPINPTSKTRASVIFVAEIA